MQLRELNTNGKSRLRDALSLSTVLTTAKPTDQTSPLMYMRRPQYYRHSIFFPKRGIPAGSEEGRESQHSLPDRLYAEMEHCQPGTSFEHSAQTNPDFSCPNTLRCGASNPSKPVRLPTVASTVCTLQFEINGHGCTTTKRRTHTWCKHGGSPFAARAKQGTSAGMTSRSRIHSQVEAGHAGGRPKPWGYIQEPTPREAHLFLRGSSPRAP